MRIVSPRLTGWLQIAPLERHDAALLPYAAQACSRASPRGGRGGLHDAAERDGGREMMGEKEGWKEGQSSALRAGGLGERADKRLVND